MKLSDEQGSAVVEFIAFAAILQVPALLVATSLVGVQHDQLAAEAMNREALRAYTLIGRPPQDTAAIVAEAFKVAEARYSISYDCSSDDCDASDTWVSMITRVGSAVAKGKAHR